jgi:hypothetical protein
MKSWNDKTVVFATMLTGPGINADYVRVCNSFTWFIFNLHRRKLSTVLYNNIQWTVLMRVLFKCKNLVLEVVAISARCESHSTLVSC